MTEHPDRETLEAFVTGALPPAETDETTRRLEAHLSRCDDCAAALAREARLEEALIETAAFVADRPRPAPLRRRAFWATLAATPVAAAAAWLMVVGGGRQPVSPAFAPETVAPRTVALAAAVVGALPVCGGAAGQRLCARAAQRRGLAFRSGERIVVPRYEGMAWAAFDLPGATRLIP
jgi:anti-sigma factor RsiW